MDETNFNLHISRRDGRSIRGSRATSISSGSKGPNVHMIGCIGSLGLIHHEIRRGSFTKELAKDWMRTAFRLAREKNASPIVMVIDNAGCHSGIESILLEDEFQDHIFLRLGPYSPMLNPIETIWSKVKAHVKRNLSSNLQNLLQNNPENLPIVEFRLRNLEELMRQSLEVIDISCCVSCISGVARYFSAALAL